MARERFYPMMRMFDPDEFFDNITRSMSLPAFDDHFAGITSGFGARTDVYRKDGKIFVEAELPGIDSEDVDLHVYSDRLTLSAEKKAETTEGDKDKSYFRSERRWGKVERVVAFPVEADPESAEASFKNGVLTVSVSEKSQDKAHKKLTIKPEA